MWLQLLINLIFDSVAILALYYTPMLSKPLYIEIRAGKNARILSFLRPLPGLRIFSEYDSTSAFHGIGKRRWLNIAEGNEEHCNALGFLGKSLQIEDHLFYMIESMVCQVYGFLKKPNANDVRHEKCCGEKFPKPAIPPTKDELHNMLFNASNTKHLFGKTR